MQAYFGPQNEGRVDNKLLDAAQALMADLRKTHDGACFPQEMAAVESLEAIIEQIKKRDQRMRKEAEFLATELGTICWKITRKTRNPADVRKGLAGITKKIGDLLDD